jgi:hypothetical protein
MLWANFLHIYQPPTQIREITEKVTRESYRPIVELLLAHPRGRITLNINGVLTEQLARWGGADVLAGLRTLAERGQIEFTGSAKFHPILPLLPDAEITRQIELNEQANRAAFGEAYRPRGFFCPEMCYSRRVAEVAIRLGYRWLIIDEICYDGRLGQARPDTWYTLAGHPEIGIAFKERAVSAAITYGQAETLAAFRRLVGDRARGNVVLTGTDGEVYGHHRRGQEGLLAEAFDDPEVEAARISDLPEMLSRRAEIDPLSGSWSTWEDEMAARVPYPQWWYPGNALHDLQWALSDLALAAIRDADHHAPEWQDARHLLDEGLHSCQYWWASCRPWWDVGMIDRGAALLRDAVQRAPGVPDAVRARARAMAGAVVETARRWHDTGHARTLQRQYMDQHGSVTSLLTFGAVS